MAAGGVVLMGGPLSLAAKTQGGAFDASPSREGLTESPLGPRKGRRGSTMFKLMDPAETGVVTENKYADPSMWGARFSEFDVGSIGTGVAIGDYDGDGRPDIFVVSKTESCRLFRNLGNWKFEDVTEKAGVGDKGADAAIWKQGATFVDINNNGLLDLYVCRAGAPNLLYMNQGDGTFREEAVARGLAVVDTCVMAAFCDYDRDGHMDVFIQTNAPEAAGQMSAQRNYLFRNNGDGTFTDVSEKAGITGRAQGHSAIWWDYDGDGWPDLYVANDFTPNDKLYHNNRDGTFTDVIDTVVPHMPFSSMGADLGDVNNDGLVDFFVSDMAATTHQKDQRTIANSRSLIYDQNDDAPEAPEYMRNALYISTGTGRCLEAANLAGIAATNWTWSVRLEDLDNDGRLDLFVTNGMYRETNNADLLSRMMMADSPEAKVAIEHASPEMPEQHLAFRNLGELKFEDVSAAWGLNQRGIAFGAALGDLDGDGNLDIVYANYHGGVTLLRNDCDSGHSIIVALRGTKSNRFGVGSTVRITTEAGEQVRPLVLSRGIMSSSEPVLHFGVGESINVMSLSVRWPSGHYQVFKDLGVNRKYTVTEPSGVPGNMMFPSPDPQYVEVGSEIGFSLRSRETIVDETVDQPLLPMRQNRRGPAIAVGDINGDGRDDVILGGTPPDPARIAVGMPTQNFAAMDGSSLADPGPLSDGPMLLFDAMGDGRNALLITKAGSARPAGSPEFQPRLLLNDGYGSYSRAPEGSLPPLPISAGAVAAADFDRSGRLGVFIGGRVLPGQYPLPPRSALLANRGGRFEDVTDSIAPGIREVGMVTGALWSDVDGDGWPDLMLTLEWGGVKYFHNNQGKGFEDWSERSGFAAAGTGWWSSIAAADFNGDGRPDYVVGNVGLNTQYHASPENPALIFVGDFKGDGGSQLVEAYYEGGLLYPWRTRKDLGAVVPSILRKFPRNDYYARATLPEILGERQLAAATRFTATEFRSGVFLSQPDGTHKFSPLPRIAQVAPIQGLVAGDFNGDGRADIYAVHNSYSPVAAVGRFDGGLSQFLVGDGMGGFMAAAPGLTGLVVPGDAKALAVTDFDQDGRPDFLVSRNNGRTMAFRRSGPDGSNSVRVNLSGRRGNPTAVGAFVTAEYADGSTQSVEIHAGSGYYSQSCAACFFGWLAQNRLHRLRVRWPSGARSSHEFDGKAAITTLSEPSS